jgi:hypothetical protein
MAESTTEDQGRDFGEVTEKETEGTEAPVTEVKTEETGDQTENTEETGKTAEAEVTENSEGKPAEPILTEKGTKLDPNPESAIHQELANERRKTSQMTEVLGNPKLLAAFLEKQHGIKVSATSQDEVATENKPAAPIVKQYTAEDFESLEDVANVVNGLQTQFGEKLSTVEKENKELKGVVTNLLSGKRAQDIVTTTERGISSLSKEPELDPKSPQFIPGLEDEIGAEYLRLDFDKETGDFRGTNDIAEIGKRILAVARKSVQKGSLDAQTIVKDKSVGKVATSSKVKEETGADNLAPADSIAQGIQKMFR